MKLLPESILLHAQSLAEGGVLSPKEFLHLASRAAVDQALSRLAKEGRLLRVVRGSYVAPVSSRFGTRAPAPEKVVQALAAQTGEVVTPHGAHAANALGLTAAVANPAGLPDLGTYPQAQARARRGHAQTRSALDAGAGIRAGRCGRARAGLAGADPCGQSADHLAQHTATLGLADAGIGARHLAILDGKGHWRRSNPWMSPALPSIGRTRTTCWNRPGKRRAVPPICSKRTSGWSGRSAYWKEAHE